MQNNPLKPIWVNKKKEPLKFEQAKKPYKIFVATPVHSEVSLHYTQALLEFQNSEFRIAVYVYEISEIRPTKLVLFHRRNIIDTNG